MMLNFSTGSAVQEDNSAAEKMTAQQLAQQLKDNPELVQKLRQAVEQSQAQQTTQHSNDNSATSQQSSDSRGAEVLQDKVTAAQMEQGLNQEAFKAVRDEAFPLSPNQIKTLHNMLDDTQLATATAPFDMPPQPTSSSLFVNLAPGATPPVIRLSRGFVSSLVFIDSTGAPWPIEAFDLGNPTVFNISWNKKDNTLMVQARSSYTYGNLAVKLAELNTPVMLTLVPGQKVVDYRVDLRVQGIGPQAKPTLRGSGMPSAANSLLLNILDGVAPSGSVRLQVQGNLAEAWLHNGKMYLRSRFHLLSPAWFAKMSSADGTNAYELQSTPTVLMSHEGKPVHLKIEGF